MSKTWIQDDLDAFISILPARISIHLREHPEIDNLLEVVLDLGRPPEARFPGTEIVLETDEVTTTDLDETLNRVGEFGDDNRAGIERTLHRISAIRNRKGKVVGLTCRVGRAVFGTIRIIEDLILSERNVLLMGRPGVGKTTMLREVARVLADEANKRVIIVDTSNEISGDGDIPHTSIGHARRMQVTTPSKQHSVMIEAVENHMPEVIIIDEMGTELEAAAARTIAERGVQLIATAHGNTLENLVMNPTLTDLVGGIEAVTLGDDEARRRGSQKTILERKSPPTFDILVEIQHRDKVAVHHDVAQVVDNWLRGNPSAPENRSIDKSGEITKDAGSLNVVRSPQKSNGSLLPNNHHNTSRIYGNAQSPTTISSLAILPFGITTDYLQKASEDVGINIVIADDISSANIVLTTKAHFRRRPLKLKMAEESKKTIYIVRRNSIAQMKQFLTNIGKKQSNNQTLDTAMDEAQKAADRVIEGEKTVPLTPQRAYIRKLQHMLAVKNQVLSVSNGREPQRHVTFYGH